MIQRERYEALNAQIQSVNILRNAYRIHDLLEQEVRTLGAVDFVTPTPIAVNVKDYLSIKAADAAQEVLRTILDPAQ